MAVDPSDWEVMAADVAEKVAAATGLRVEPGYLGDGPLDTNLACVFPASRNERAGNVDHEEIEVRVRLYLGNTISRRGRAGTQAVDLAPLTRWVDAVYVALESFVTEIPAAGETGGPGRTWFARPTGSAIDPLGMYADVAVVGVQPNRFRMNA